MRHGRCATYDSGVDSQCEGGIALFTMYTHCVCEDGDAAAFVAHEHVAFERRDDVELC